MRRGGAVCDRPSHTKAINRTQNFPRNETHMRHRKRHLDQRRNRNRLRNEVIPISSGEQVDGFHMLARSEALDPHLESLQGDERPTESPPISEGTGEAMPLVSTPIDCNLQVGIVEALETSLSSLNLRETLIEQLRSGSYACLICLSNVEPVDKIWSCFGCYRVYHLSCITDWAISNTQKSGAEPRTNQKMRSSWRCPACQKSYSSLTTSLIYRCFCGKTVRPEYRPGFSTIPHGCDEVCGRSKALASEKANQQNRRASPCPHTCTELCHPGPCPPCTALVQLHCPCGRVVQTSRCGEEPPKPCGAPCDRLLPTRLCAFGSHHCPLLCHDGDCPPCRKLIKSGELCSLTSEFGILYCVAFVPLVCYCGRVDEVTRCGSEKAKRYDLREARLEAVVGTLDLFEIEMFFDGGEEEKAAILASEEAVEAIFVGTVFSCEQTCDRPLACGHHKCIALCHPGECQPCPLLPSQCLTCPCGRVRLSQLVMNGDEHGNRKECTDPIPVCPNVCGRPNSICGHPCPEKCHPGPNCPQCKLTTKITCRCGKSSKEIPCLEYTQAVKKDPSKCFFTFLPFQGGYLFTLQTPSNFCVKGYAGKRNPAGDTSAIESAAMRRYYIVAQMVIHACQAICGRTLACGKHTCEDLCHCGPCGSCWRGVINEEVYCHCGATVLPPPQPCGTKPPECNQPCSRPHSCDHPVQHTCHSEPECPKCTVLMTKRCPGGE
ncbi:unnamed protein product [Hydatigera taeniaeformis]|uniref:RING-type domain-containing protein n=1 Tax=Hydatigena taeniaeformis TaxID=6205 RepID=A0A0R3X6U4_HYDTA|nr:unnamed protein product [Hydatigera taeniaeformis]